MSCTVIRCRMPVITNKIQLLRSYLQLVSSARLLSSSPQLVSSAGLLSSSHKHVSSSLLRKVISLSALKFRILVFSSHSLTQQSLKTLCCWISLGLPVLKQGNSQVDKTPPSLVCGKLAWGPPSPLLSFQGKVCQSKQFLSVSALFITRITLQGFCCL